MMRRNAAAFEATTPEDRMKPGAYEFMYEYSFELGRNTDRKVGIKHACPCGCGSRSAMWFRGGSMNGEGTEPDHEWDVKGEWPKVTLSPSIGIGRGQGASPDRKTGTSAGFHWHGYLRDGVFEEG